MTRAAQIVSLLLAVLTLSGTLVFSYKCCLGHKSLCVRHQETIMSSWAEYNYGNRVLKACITLLLLQRIFYINPFLNDLLL